MLERRLRLWKSGRLTWRKIAPHARHVQIDAVIALALDMGLRRIEIYELGLDDLHYDNEYVVVTAKGKTREVPFSTHAREKVRAWIELRTMLFGDPGHDRPWLSLQRRPEPSNALGWRQFQSILMGGWTLHRLRHTCATERLRANMPLEAVSKLLGHSTLAQTLAYAEIARPDLLRHIERSQDTFAEAVGS